jgi:uncharacterized protein YprB with RNaseH-like and TPR domain
MPSLDDLRRIIRRIETARPPRPAPEPAERVLGGTLLESEAGACVVVRREYPLDHRQGVRPLTDAVSATSALLSLLARATEPGLDPRRLVFLDTETTGLAGGTGTYAFLVGTGWFEDDRFVVVQHFMRDFDDEPALLAALDPVLSGASAVVTFNGGGFDLPLLETRFVLARRRWPGRISNVDLLRPARRVWSTCLDDCRLGTLERRILGLARADDVPGASIPTLYFDFLRHRRAAPLARVLAHNRDDVLSLAALLGWFTRALRAEGALAPGEQVGLGRLCEDVDLDRALAYYRDAVASGAGGEAVQWARLRLAWWEKRRARWDAACALWEAAARYGVFNPSPWEELAKYHEHRRGDVVAARSVVVSALDLAHAAGAPGRVLDALAYRLGRLERRTRRIVLAGD